MTRFLHRVLRTGVIVAAVLGRLWERIELPFLSKAEAARRASGKLETLKRKDLEAERIDRLTNPRNYQGK
jgi:hypothetical protein